MKTEEQVVEGWQLVVMVRGKEIGTYDFNDFDEARAEEELRRSKFSVLGFRYHVKPKTRLVAV